MDKKNKINYSYEEFIQNIINTRGQWTQLVDEYGNLIPYENHHIIPRCLGGEPQKSNHTMIHENLVWLTFEEHYIAHKLLALENPNNDSIVYAFSCMVQYKDGEELSTEDAVLNRKLLSQAPKIKWHNSMDKRTEKDKAETLQKRHNTNLVNHGIPNYNNWDKHRETINSKSEEENYQIYLKWKASNDARSEEEKFSTHNKRVESHLNFSEDKRDSINKKLRETLANKTEEQKLASLEKARQTIANRSEEKKKQVNETRSKVTSGGRNGRAKKVICTTTGEIFSYMKEASEKHNISLYWISKSIKEKVSDPNGNFWEFL